MPAYSDAGLCLQGLNQGSDASTQDLAYVMRRMKALGFNTIKLPFSFTTLYETPLSQFNYPQSCAVPSEQSLLAGLTPPGCAPRRAQALGSLAPGVSGPCLLAVQPRTPSKAKMNGSEIPAAAMGPSWQGKPRVSSMLPLLHRALLLLTSFVQGPAARPS